MLERVVICFFLCSPRIPVDTEHDNGQGAGTISLRSGQGCWGRLMGPEVLFPIGCIVRGRRRERPGEVYVCPPPFLGLSVRCGGSMAYSMFGRARCTSGIL